MVDPDKLAERRLDHAGILSGIFPSEIVRSGTTADRITSLTTTEAAVLALLAIEGERSRYDLMNSVSKAIGYVWTPAKTQLYALLPRLEDRGLATSRTVREGARPEKKLFQITDAGRAELDEWLVAEPESVETFHLRLFVGRLVPPEVLLEHVHWFRERTQVQLDEYLAIEPTNTRTGNDSFHYFLLRLGIERMEHLLRWSDWVLGELEEREAA
jgi:DNA-binding PadR family transcriptional regulator